MKSLAVVAILLINSALLFSQGAEFSFDDKNLKLPKTLEGEIVEFAFPFTNKGKPSFATKGVH